MARSRWLIAPAAVVVLAACGASTDSSTISTDATPAGTGGPSTTIVAVPGSPAVIHLSTAGGSPASAAGSGTTPAEQGNGADGAIEPMPIQPSIVTYVTSG